jgi:acyl-CoA dehydrogenase
MAVIRDHLASKGLGLFNDLQNEHSVVGNFPVIVMLRDFGTQAQKDKFIHGQLELQDPHHLRPDRAQPRLRRHPHGDAAVRETRNGASRLAHQRREDVDHRHAHRHPLRAVRRTSGKAGDAKGITCFLVPPTPRA